jgi:hypothetical protein
MVDFVLSIAVEMPKKIYILFFYIYIVYRHAGIVHFLTL